MLFKPTRDDGRSYRDVAVEFLKDKPPECVVSYKELGDALGLQPKNERHKIQQVVRMANRHLLKIYNRAITNVATTGYRVLPAREHMIVANGHQTKADRAMSRAINFYEGANLSEMTETERKLHQGQHMLAQAIYASHKHLDKRIKRIEDLLGGEKDGKVIDA